MDFPFIRPQDAIAALHSYMIAHGATLPEFPLARVQEAMAAMSPVDTIIMAGEALYGARSEIDNDGKMLGARLIEFASRFGWHGLNDGARGSRIVAALCRDAGEVAPEGSPWPDASTDPEPAPGAIPAVPIVNPLMPPPA